MQVNFVKEIEFVVSGSVVGSGQQDIYRGSWYVKFLYSEKAST